MRYADDFVCCFQSKSEAQQFFHSLKLRLKKFNLEIAEDKTKIIPFGRFAEQNANQQGEINQQLLISLGLLTIVGKVNKGNFE
ncbi:reverse transcriptase domain-containing protein [Neobacillus pocheonensis]|uniref:Reverse transcriptase domain-containing protein n=1 Tax=Neobacillus pocheonensis TaxID=363869 RepID=A0ABT0WGV1_9BACI|nr:reverse transcriptase domain-containing protein [Neobacillus pocheonensis]